MFLFGIGAQRAKILATGLTFLHQLTRKTPSQHKAEGEKPEEEASK